MNIVSISSRIALSLIFSASIAPLHSQITFYENGIAAGLATTFSPQGVAVADYDVDGDDDILFAGWYGVALFQNDGSAHFTNVTATSGVSRSGRYVAPIFADWDNDSDPDLFLGAQDAVGTNRLLRNDSGHFTDVTKGSGIDTLVSVGTAAAGDFNNDGRLDLFLATRDSPDRLYRNSSVNSTMTFDDVTSEAGVAGGPSTIAMQATWIDYDQDGDVDLFAVHDGFDKSQLFRNDGTMPMPDVAPQVHLDSVGAGNSMGVAWGDMNNDGWQDVYVTRIDHGGLYRNVAGSNFQEIAATANADSNGMSWGVAWSDFDNDGNEDLAIVNIASFGGLHRTSLLYRNNGNGTFTDVGPQSGFASNADFYGLATGDFNGDGRQDIVGASFSPSGQNKLWINATSGVGNWASFHLRGTSVNRGAVGATILVRAGGQRFVRSVIAGSSYCSQVSPVALFGVGSAAILDTVEVTWGPGKVEYWFGLAVNTTHQLDEGTATGVADETEQVQEVEDPVALHNYPNPFNTSTRISFSLSFSGRVRLEIFDQLGRSVALIADQRFEAGSHSATFNASLLPSGVYLCRLTTSRSSSIRALLLVK